MADLPTENIARTTEPVIMDETATVSPEQMEQIIQGFARPHLRMGPPTVVISTPARSDDHLSEVFQQVSQAMELEYGGARPESFTDEEWRDAVQARLSARPGGAETPTVAERILQRLSPAGRSVFDRTYSRVLGWRAVGMVCERVSNRVKAQKLFYDYQNAENRAGGSLTMFNRALVLAARGCLLQLSVDPFTTPYDLKGMYARLVDFCNAVHYPSLEELRELHGLISERIQGTDWWDGWNIDPFPPLAAVKKLLDDESLGPTYRKIRVEGEDAPKSGSQS